MSFDHFAQNAQVAMQQGNQSAAEQQLKQGIQTAEQQLGANVNKDDRVANLYNQLGKCLQNQGRFGEAEEAYKKALEVRQAALGPLHASESIILENYARCLRAANKPQEAAKVDQRLLGIMNKK
jgi:tetratricopeptide (TPR) repeat protein